MTVSLVKFDTEDGMELDGILSHEASDRAIVVHVHGKCGNFYQNRFIQLMMQTYRNSGIGFLSFNNRGHHCVAEAYVQKQLEYTGGSIEIFEDCLLDIKAALTFAARVGSTTIVLQGHSIGCEKALYYVTKQSIPALRGLVLLSPADSRRLQELYVSPRSLSEQTKQLEPGSNEFGFLPVDAYGIDRAGKSYFIPVFRKSLLATLTGDALGVINYDSPRDAASVSVPAFIYLGRRDPLLTSKVDSIERILEAEI